MTDNLRGILAMILACVIWGLSPLFYALIKHVPPLEVLGWRTLWSLVFFAVVLLVQRRLRELPRALAQPRQVVIIAVASVLIAANWFLFIFSIQAGRAVESSLGYYIFPLVAVILGRIFFAEALSRAQWVAVALAGVAVAVLTFGLGVAPWISLLLAGTFGAYGVIKKQLQLGPVVSVAAEVLVLMPVALAWLVVQGHWWDWTTMAILALSGPMTGGPLMLFSYAAKRARLSTVGLVQYLNPTLQFLVATQIFREPFTMWHAMAFPIIWGALAIYSLSALRAK